LIHHIRECSVSVFPSWGLLHPLDVRAEVRQQ